MYRNAARSVSYDSSNVGKIKDTEELKKIDGIGVAVSSKIIELQESGKIEELEDLRESIPTGLIELLKIEGIGPKTAKIP